MRFTLPLHSSDDVDAGLKVTIVIGPNGSGKSSVVARLADELDAMEQLRRSDTSDLPRHRIGKNTHATIEYKIDDRVYKIHRSGDSLHAEVDGTTEVNSRPISAADVPFPSAVLAVAHLPADKFRFSLAEQASFYRYLGLRQATNLATTGSLEASVISSLLNGHGLPHYRRALSEWLGVLGVEERLSIELVNLRPDALQVNGFAALERVSKKSQLRAQGISDYFLRSPVERFRAVNDESLAIFFAELRGAIQPVGLSSDGRKRRHTFELRLDKIENATTSGGLSWETGVEIIRKFRLADAVRLNVYKKGRATPFAELSSGERQVIGTVTRLFEHALTNSVVIIDEPEVSLHPSWQVRYIPTLLGALRHLRAAHVIVATHSHFMVSDVGPEGSLVIAKGGSNEEWQFERFTGDVYGRAPENILYRVFGVAGTSNFYVEHDLARALAMVSGSQPADRDELQSIRARLSSVTGRDNPAFQEILSNIDLYLDRDSNASA